MNVQPFAEMNTVSSAEAFLPKTVQQNRLPQTMVCQLLLLGEALAIGGLAATVIAFVHQSVLPGFDLVCGAAATAMLLLTAFMTGAAGYDRFASRLSLLCGAALVALFGATAAVLAGAYVGRAALVSVSLFVGVGLAKFISMTIKRALERNGYLCRLVGIASDDPELRAAMMALLQDRPDIRVVFIGSPSDIGTLGSLTQNNQLDEIVLAGHEARQENIIALAGLAVTLARVTPQDRLQRLQFDAHWGHKRVYSSWGAPASVIARPPMQGWRGVAKRIVDISGAASALLLFSPLLIACAIAVKLESPGPILFFQERAGYRNKPFRMMKFRSMRSDMADFTASQLTRRNDSRVTRVGAILRRTSADELPQLFNVLMGQMSLVGPRPHPKGAKAGTVLYDDLIPNFYSRYRMKPGITGLAQVSGLRGNTETEQHLIDRFSRDMQYAAEWTPVLDFVILFRTVIHLSRGTNAY